MNKNLSKMIVGMVFVSYGLTAGGEAKLTSVSEAWQLLPLSGSECEEEDLIFDYGIDGGMRNFFCRALTVYSWKAFMASAPVPPFRSGPHKNGKLNLNSGQFGYYDPKFVVWATNTLIPAADSPILRRKTQGIYDSQVAELAHIYFLVYQKLDSNPELADSERKRYLDPSDESEGGIDPYRFLGDPKSVGGDYDSNLVCSSLMWWLRRQQDGTAYLWHQGLIKLLTTYDAVWLRDQNIS